MDMIRKINGIIETIHTYVHTFMHTYTHTYMQKRASPMVNTSSS